MPIDNLRRLYLVTHAEAQHHLDGRVGGWFDSELTGAGRLQANRIAAVLAERIGGAPVRVHTSDLRRAQQTATPVARALGVEAIADPRWRERSFGEAGGRLQEWWNEHVVPLPPGSASFRSARAASRRSDTAFLIAAATS